MIEKFTDEELAQIRKELREKDRVSQKDKPLRDQFSRAICVLDFRMDPDLQSSFSAYEVKGALSLLVDHALKNYVINERRRNTTNQTTYKRNPLIPGEMEAKYLAAYTAIVDVLEEISEPWAGGKGD